MSSSKVDVSGSGASHISAGGGITASTLLGGSGADTINLAGVGFSTSQVVGGAGNDTFTFESGLGLNASIVGGAGDDSVNIITAAAGHTGGSATNTYFFGSGGGKDTINFGSAQAGAYSTGTIAFTIAVDSTYGATADYSFTGNTGKLSFGNDNNFLTISGVTGSASNSPSALGITFTTVATSVITALG